MGSSRYGAPARSTSTVAAMQVLICDDEPSIRLLFRTAFERAGANVVEACDGDECLELAVREQPDLVVLDLWMPNRDGLSTLPELRERCPASRVLIVSAHAAVEVQAKGRALGASACFDKTSFLARIPSLVARYSAA